jgi:hypothetical protein
MQTLKHAIPFLPYLLKFKPHFICFYCIWTELGTEITLFDVLVCSTALYRSGSMCFSYNIDLEMPNNSRLCI